MNSPPNGMSHKDYERRIEDIKLCGRNRGPHNWIAVGWMETIKEETKFKSVTRVMCGVCFTRVDMDTILREFPNISIKYS